ncbi:hypothetical protein LEMLEM_LOCUS25143, partial [Lemmus lemmus]
MTQSVTCEDETLWVASNPIWAFHDNETRLFLAAPIYFKRKMGIKEDPYGVCQPFGQENCSCLDCLTG